MLDSWEICQPSAWAFQTMPHNVLDSPEKQPGAWKLPAHHLNSLIWALSGSPYLSCSLCAFISLHLSLSLYLIFSPNSTPKLSFAVTNTLFQIPSVYIFILAIPCPWTHSHCYIFLLLLFNPSQKPHVSGLLVFQSFSPHSVLPQLFNSVKHHQMPLIWS